MYFRVTLAFLYTQCKCSGVDCKRKLTTVYLIGTVSFSRARRMLAAPFCEGNSGQTVTAKLMANTSQHQQDCPNMTSKRHNRHLSNSGR
jgi:hypothetical protein